MSSQGALRAAAGALPSRRQVLRVGVAAQAPAPAKPNEPERRGNRTNRTAARSRANGSAAEFQANPSDRPKSMAWRTHAFDLQAHQDRPGSHVPRRTRIRPLPLPRPPLPAGGRRAQGFPGSHGPSKPLDNGAWLTARYRGRSPAARRAWGGGRVRFGSAISERTRGACMARSKTKFTRPNCTNEPERHRKKAGPGGGPTRSAAQRESGTNPSAAVRGRTRLRRDYTNEPERAAVPNGSTSRRQSRTNPRSALSKRTRARQHSRTNRSVREPNEPERGEIRAPRPGVLVGRGALEW
jgi:hypothetical protein